MTGAVADDGSVAVRCTPMTKQSADGLSLILFACNNEYKN